MDFLPPEFEVGDRVKVNPKEVLEDIKYGSKEERDKLVASLPTTVGIIDMRFNGQWRIWNYCMKFPDEPENKWNDFPMWGIWLEKI